MVVESDRHWIGWDTNWKMFAAILIGFVLLGAQQTFARPPHRHLICATVGGCRSGYPVSKGAGNLGVTAFGVGVGLCAVLTAIVVRRRMAAAD